MATTIQGRSLLRPIAASALLLALQAYGLGASASTYYVSTQGSDSWSGTLATPTGTDGPFKTLARAQMAVRAAIAAGLASNVTVMIRAGEYPETMLFLNPADAAPNGYKVIYQNYPGEHPLVHAGRRLTGWQLDHGSIYKVPVTWTFDTLYENGVRSEKARHPNSSSANPYAYSRTTAQVSGASMTKFGFAPGDIPRVGDPTSLEIVIWPGGPDGIWNWSQMTFTQNTVDYATGVASLGHTICCGISRSAPWEIGRGSRYFVQGARELLDQPGEFWVGNGYLYYWPRKLPIEGQVIVAPAPGNQSIFGIGAGSFQNFNLEISGLSLAYTDRDQNAIFASNIGQLTLKGNHIFDAGGAGISVAGTATDVTIEANLIHDVGADGISFYGDANLGYPTRFTVSNNHVHHVGQLHGDSSSIVVGRSSNGSVSHNLLHDTPRWGLRSYGSADHVPPVFDASRITFEYNDVSRAVMDSQDAGLLHLSGVGPEVIVNNNRFHHSGLAFSYGEGIYLDVCNSGVTVTRNLVHDLQPEANAGITYDAIEVKGRSIAVTNNVVVNNRLSRAEIDVNRVDLDPAGSCSSSSTSDARIDRNLLANNGTAFIYSFPNFDESQIAMADYNLFYHGGAVYVAGFGYGDGTHTFSAMAQTLDQWRSLHATRYDTQSITTDPLFVDEANKDFRLRPESPAYGLGFQDIDYESIGLTADFPFSDAADPIDRLFVKSSQSGASATLRLSAGQTARLSASARTVTGYLQAPPNATLSFSSDRPGVAAVDAQGAVTAGSPGLATIRVTATQGAASKSTVLFVLVRGIADCLFDWGEDSYPSLFVPSRPISQTWAPYYFRYYAATNAYLGTSSSDGHLYYMGPASNNSLLDLGPAFTWYGKAACH